MELDNKKSKTKKLSGQAVLLVVLGEYVGVWIGADLALCDSKVTMGEYIDLKGNEKTSENG